MWVSAASLWVTSMMFRNRLGVCGACLSAPSMTGCDRDSVVGILRNHLAAGGARDACASTANSETSDIVQKRRAYYMTWYDVCGYLSNPIQNASQNTWYVFITQLNCACQDSGYSILSASSYDLLFSLIAAHRGSYKGIARYACFRRLCCLVI